MTRKWLLRGGGVIALYFIVLFGSARLHWSAYERSLPPFAEDASGAIPAGINFEGWGAPGEPEFGARTEPPKRILRSTVAGAIHVHTERSHDSEGTREEVARAARAAGLGFVLLSDHPSRETPDADVPDAPYLQDGVLLVDGREVSFGRNVGRVLVFGLDTTLVHWRGGGEEFADLLRRRGGTVIAAHPRSPLAREAWHLEDAAGIQGWEAFDLSDVARRRALSPSGPYHLISLLGGLPLGLADRSLVRLYREGFGSPAAAAFDSLSMRQPLTAMAGVNAHPKRRVAGRILPGYAPFFRAVANHVLLDGELPLDPLAAGDSIAAAVAGGRVFVSFRDVEGARGFAFGIEQNGRVVAGPGDSIALEPGFHLRSGVPAGGRRLAYRVVRDGSTFAWVRGRELSVEVTEPGTYRVEVHRYTAALGRLTWNRRPWIFSNPVRVRPAA